MNRELITFKTAKRAFKVGFSSYTPMGYDKNGNIEISNPCVFFSNKKDSKIIEAPEQEILQKWLREYHDIDVHVYKDDINYMTKYSNKKYPEYTLALEEGLYEALKLI